MDKTSLHIVKIGGQLAEDPRLLGEVLDRFTVIEAPKILVHGGGVMASEWCQRLGIPVQMVDGRRITDEASLEVAIMVYAGLTNKRIVAALQQRGCNALGLSGADANIIVSHKRSATTIDYGWVGDIDKVNAAAFEQLLQAGFTPVCCAITHDGQGRLLNTNADTIAQEIAGSLATRHKVSLHFYMEKAGVMTNPDHPDTLLPGINTNEYRQLKASGAISGGMIPKLDNAFRALESGINEVFIGKTRVTL